MTTWTVNGVDLSTHPGWILENASVWRPGASTRRAVVELPHRHGTVPAGGLVFDEATITIVVYLYGTDDNEVEARGNELIGLFSHPTLTVQRTSGGMTSTAPASLVAMSPSDYVVGVRARYTILLALPGVFFRSFVNTSGTLTTGAGGTDIVVPVVSGSTAPVGDAIIRAKGPLSSVTVTDLATSTGISWVGSGVTSTQYLYLDTRSVTAWRDTSASMWEGAPTDVTAGLDYPTEGPLQLWPTVQGGDLTDRQAKVNIAVTGSGAGTAVVIRAARSYL